MAVTEVKRGTVTFIEIAWDTEIVQGDEAEILAENPNDPDNANDPSGFDFAEWKRTVRNNGTTRLYFPEGYTGTCNVIVAGSDSGEDSGTLEV